MHTLLIHNLQIWQTFYIVLATAAASFLGLLFVALSLSTGDIYEERTPVIIGIFITPVYNQFLNVLIIALLLIIPIQTSVSLSVLLLILFIYTTIANISLVRLVIKHYHLITTRVMLTNIILPILGSFAILVSAFLLIISPETAFMVLSVVTMFLLLVGISNSWQIMKWNTQQKNKLIDDGKKHKKNA